ncbi:zinc ribbon domain-containing protein [Solibacillus sp. CAU 1738]|uniref:double zinc ribbon domain-containing protein n=1 Tax=Solibacillus sp. CAU 1738 TaxID=3140363 RepID=UPI00326187C4
MERDKFIPDQHRKARSFFRILGPTLLIISLVCMIVAAVDFFTLQIFEEPKYFWLFFVAIPLLFVGFTLSGLGYGGNLAKYQSREYAPVAKDTFNYLAKETTVGVKEISNAIQQGNKSNQSLNCLNCHQQNPINAKFCNQCGEHLILICQSCKQENIVNASFCNHCGTELS